MQYQHNYAKCTKWSKIYLGENEKCVRIGRPKKGMSVVHHVLSKFDQENYVGILQSIDKVDDAVNYYLQEKNFEKTMQRYNG